MLWSLRVPSIHSRKTKPPTRLPDNDSAHAAESPFFLRRPCRNNVSLAGSPNISCFLYIHTHKQLPVIHGAAEANCLQTVCLQSRLLRERRTILFKPTSAPALCFFFAVFFLCSPSRGDGKQRGQRRLGDLRPSLSDINQRESRAGSSARPLQRPLFYGYCGRGYRRASGNRLDNGAAYSR